MNKRRRNLLIGGAAIIAGLSLVFITNSHQAIYNWVNGNLPILGFTITLLGGYFLWRFQGAGTQESLSGAVDKMVNSFSRLSDEFDEYKLKAEKQVADLTRKYEQGLADLSKLQREVIQLRKENDDLRKERSTRNVKIEKLEARVKELEIINDSLRLALDGKQDKGNNGLPAQEAA